MLSEVPDGWAVEAFDKVARLQSGFAFKSKQFVDDPKQGLPIIRIRDLNSQSPSKYYAGEISEEYKVNAGDILVGMDGQFDCVEWQGEQAALNQRVLRVFPTENSEKKFLHYMLTPILKVLEGQITGTTVKHLSTRNLKSLNLPIPPLTEQKRIAEVLSSVDESIQATQRLIEQAERVKQGLMEELLTGGLGSEAIERGEVPEGWSANKLGELVKLEYGKSLPARDRIEGDYPVYGSAGIVGTHNDYLVSEPSIIVGRKGTVGAIYKTNKPFYAIDTTYFVVPKIDLDLSWLAYLLKHLKLVRLSEATGVPGLNRDKTYKVTVAVPSIVKQQEITQILNSIESTIDVYERAINGYMVTKKGLMDDLLTGKVRTV